MAIRAKFRVQEVTRFSADPTSEMVKLQAVYGTEGENASWSKATPAGTLTMTISNPAAVGKLEVGKSYYLDFTEAD